MDLREVEALLSELESRTDRLRALYEQYFMGFERLEPTVPRKDVERRLQQLLRVPFRNTALRFRFTMLQQRYNTYQTYWMRTCRKIEDGTYKRQIQRMKAKETDFLRNVEAAAKDEPAIEIAEVDGFGDEDLESAAPTLPPPPPPPPSEPPVLQKDANGKWMKPPPGSTFDTRPTTPRMKAVRIPKKDETPVAAPVAAAAPAPEAKTAPPPAPEAPKPKAAPPPLPPRPAVKISTVPNEMHSRPTTPRMQAVRLPEKKTGEK